MKSSGKASGALWCSHHARMDRNTCKVMYGSCTAWVRVWRYEFGLGSVTFWNRMLSVRDYKGQD